MTARTGIVIQARMGSTRLPGKVLMDLAGAPMLLRQLERVRRIGGVDAIIVATSDLPGDDPLAEMVSHQPGIGLWRGSERDVLRRYAEAARAFDLDAVVRLTADCPLIEPAVVARVIAAFHAAPGCGYASNVRPRSFPHGLDCEVVSRAALEAADAEATEPFDREHVLPYVFTRPDRFPRVNVTAEDPAHADLRLTVDYPEDLALARAVYGALYPTRPAFVLADVIALLAARPDIRALNAAHAVPTS